MTEQDRYQRAFTEGYRQATQGSHTDAFSPHIAAPIIAEHLDLPESERDVLRILRRPEVRDTVYRDVTPFLQQVVDNPLHALSIWTQGEMKSPTGFGYQLLKIASSGITDSIGKDWRKKARESGIPRIFGGMDKVDLLSDIAALAYGKGLEKIVIVDDKPRFLVGAREAVKELPVKLFLMDRNGETTESSDKMQRIGSFAEIPYEELKDKRVLWLIDLDYTLIDHGKVRQNLAQKISDTLLHK